MGRFFADTTTPEMHNAIVWISSWAARNLDPTGGAPFHDIPSLPTICGHRDVNNTSCPGDEFYVRLDTVRTETRRVIRGRDDPEPPPPQWYPGMRVLTNAEGASLRDGPGLDFDVAAKVAFGEPLLVLQGPTTNDSTIWYEVQGVSLTGWIAGNLLTPDPDPVPLEPLPTETPVAAAPSDIATTVPASEVAPPVEGHVSEVDPVAGPVDNGETGDEQDGGRNRDTERRQETWPVFAAGTETIVTAGPLNLHVEPALWATILTALPAGYTATVSAGPVEGEGIVWYLVATPEGVEGWCDGSFLQPL
jgi:uncharacterized protein YgiM (DUF1202 family)